MITRAMIYKWTVHGILDRAFAKKATKKGRKHIQGEVFISINRSGVSPAVYRHEHMKMVKGKIIKMKAGKKK